MRTDQIELRTCAIILAIIIAIIWIAGCNQKDQKEIVIAVNQFVFHPNLDEVLNGCREVLAEWQNKSGIKIKYNIQNASGDVSIALQIARQQIALNPKLIIALATPSAQASMRVTKKIPIVFGAITDPVSAGLVESLDHPGTNCTGTSDIGPYFEQFKFIKELFPEKKVVGIIRNPGEINSVVSMKYIDEAIASLGFKKRESPVASTNEVLPAAKSLVGRCDFFYVPADNTVLSSLDAIVRIAESEKIPLFVGDQGSVKLGGVATIGIDYYSLGRMTGEIAERILSGESPSYIPIGYAKENRLYINIHSAKRQGVVFPNTILKSAILIEE